MIDIFLQALIGLTAGLLGGLLGVGGSVVIIPGFIFYLSHTAAGYAGSDQHLIQAAAMICNVFVAAPAVLAHRQAGAIMKPVVVRLIPSALIGIVTGVALSNSGYFARENGRYLAYILAGFLVYVAFYNIWRMVSKVSFTDSFDIERPVVGWKVIAVGLPMGLLAGLLGVGGGALAVPAQQLILRLPLRRAIANSATTILCTAIFGALYKNITLAEHGIVLTRSLQLVLLLIPTAIVGSYIGGRLTHKLPRRTLRIVFIVFLFTMSWLTYNRARTAPRKTTMSSETATVSVAKASIDS